MRIGGDETAVAVPAPGTGFGAWAGAPSAALDADGSFALAYEAPLADGSHELRTEPYCGA